MSEVKNLEDAEKQGLKILERLIPFSEFVEKFNLDKMETFSLNRSNPPDCSTMNPGDVCFRGNCEDGQRLVMFCDKSKGCGGKYTYEPC